MTNCVGSLAGVTCLRYTVLMSPSKDETAVHFAHSFAILLYRVGCLLPSRKKRFTGYYYEYGALHAGSAIIIRIKIPGISKNYI